MFTDIKFDFDKKMPVFENGRPVFVSGAEALKSWAYRALLTQRYVHKIYPRSTGNEMLSLVGKPFSQSVKESEAKRYIEECLLQNPYITSVTDFNLSFEDDHLTASFKINTIYGEEEAVINV